MSTLKVRPFSIGCVLSFCLGVGLFGAVYLMPVFLAYVRATRCAGDRYDHAGDGSGPTGGRADRGRAGEPGESALAVGLRLLACLRSGWAWSAFESRTADYDEMFWPQVLRGFAAMFCLLPPTRLALETLPHKQVPDASGLFNMMRNLGGAVGIALIDTILYGRTSGHVEALPATAGRRRRHGARRRSGSIGLPQLICAAATRRSSRRRHCSQHQRGLGA